jgi:hypothetical protein
MAEADLDQKVTQAYRALGGEEPPRALDEAILAASRHRPARWRVPLSIAAVLVLAVGVTLRLLTPRPDAELVALAPQVIPTPRPAAPVAEVAGAKDDAVPAAPAPAQPAAARAPAALQSAKRADTRAPAAVGSVQQAGTPAVEGAPRIEAAVPAPAAAEAAPRESDNRAAEQEAARREAVAGAAAEPQVRDAAAAPSAPRALSGAKLSEPAPTPEAWLERIAELRKQGREREAQESLAEFKKRYPDYKIPEALTR